ncbi:hypothetical protein [Paenibacillus sp. J2TS4]|nr:hypothetical protein [Paenibacillus sp. J2TS4]GIP31153.1 hypothetical protein J2TS4_03630 [Paenibacillus sp. J2TS4]
MDGWMILLLVAIALIALWRWKRTYSSARINREEEIRKKLEELRKKRDE